MSANVIFLYIVSFIFTLLKCWWIVFNTLYHSIFVCVTPGVLSIRADTPTLPFLLMLLLNFLYLFSFQLHSLYIMFVARWQAPRPFYHPRCSPTVMVVFNALLRWILSVLQYTKLFVQVWVLMWYFYILFHLYSLYWSVGGLFSIPYTIPSLYA